jgi:hypothetical protein
MHSTEECSRNQQRRIPAGPPPQQFQAIQAAPRTNFVSVPQASPPAVIDWIKTTTSPATDQQVQEVKIEVKAVASENDEKQVKLEQANEQIDALKLQNQRLTLLAFPPMRSEQSGANRFKRANLVDLLATVDIS